MAYAIADIDQCTCIAKKFYEKRQYRPSLEELKHELKEPTEIRNIKQTQYQWGDFYILTRDDKIILKYGEVPKELNIEDYSYMSMNIKDVIKALGRPKKTIKTNLKQFIWRCSQTQSKIKILVDPNNDIDGYRGEYCRREDSAICAAFHYDGTIMLMG